MSLIVPTSRTGPTDPAIPHRSLRPARHAIFGAIAQPALSNMNKMKAKRYIFRRPYISEHGAKYSGARLRPSRETATGRLGRYRLATWKLSATAGSATARSAPERRLPAVRDNVA